MTPHPPQSADNPTADSPSRDSAWLNTAWPATFSTTLNSGASKIYLSDPSTRKLAEFFERKGLKAIKEEDRLEQWYDDWVAYQAEHRLYASVLSPKQEDRPDRHFDLLRYTRFLEVFGYFSPAHAYSLQTTFLGFFSILMGSNEPLKTEAIATLEAGGLLAFGVSEKNHGSDLFGNEFTVRPTIPGRFTATGSKYYIGNANCASLVAILARKIDPTKDTRREKRAPFLLFALRPKQSKGYTNVRKIRTLGVRAAFVGQFDVKDHDLTDADFIAQGRDAWEAVLGTATLGKFFLGFGSVGICERAFEEAIAHLKRKLLYGKPILEMPHIRWAAAQACARLTAMKLFAYRALDYVQAARAEDRRYLLYCAVQKAKVSTEGVKVMSLLSECIAAKGFESEDTYFETALRDAQLIPLLESSAHINLGLTAQFIPRYFDHPDPNLPDPPSLTAAEAPATENSYLMAATSGPINTISFPPFDQAYAPLMNIPNVQLLSRQAKALHLFVRTQETKPDLRAQFTFALSQCVATVAYAQLIAENAARLRVPDEMISAIFQLLGNDLSASALALASLPGLELPSRALARRIVAISRTPAADWDFVSGRVPA